jgi:hypothetical protein
MRKTGIVLLIVSYALFAYGSLGAIPYAHAHPHLSATVLAQYGSPWPVALGCSIAIMGIMLALVPIRRGERWAMWTSLASWILLLAVRLSTDPRCLVVLDPHQHGCHTFMIVIMLGIAGVALSAFTRFNPAP